MHMGGCLLEKIQLPCLGSDLFTRVALHLKFFPFEVVVDGWHNLPCYICSFFATSLPEQSRHTRRAKTINNLPLGHTTRIVCGYLFSLKNMSAPTDGVGPLTKSCPRSTRQRALPSCKISTSAGNPG